MSFNHVKIDDLQFDMKSKISTQGRIYTTPDGKKYPSVTSVLGAFNKEFLEKWREKVGEEEAKKISRLAASRGTRLHNVCEKFLLNELDSFSYQSMMPDTKQLFLTLKNHLNTRVGKIYALEQALYSDTLRVAGRVDCIAEWDGELSVIDFKTSTRTKKEDWVQNYYMQCALYAQMFEDLTKRPIERIVVLIAVEDDLFPQILIKEKTEYLENARNLIDEYYELYY
jgi:ATP-dependent exoDNAse (exonuclease V) beta subunit